MVTVNLFLKPDLDVVTVSDEDVDLYPVKRDQETQRWQQMNLKARKPLLITGGSVDSEPRWELLILTKSNCPIPVLTLSIARGNKIWMFHLLVASVAYIPFLQVCKFRCQQYIPHRFSAFTTFLLLSHCSSMVPVFRSINKVLALYLSTYSLLQSLCPVIKFPFSNSFCFFSNVSLFCFLHHLPSFFRSLHPKRYFTESFPSVTPWKRQSSDPDLDQMLS